MSKLTVYSPDFQSPFMLALSFAIALGMTALPATHAAQCDDVPSCDCLPVAGPPHAVEDLLCNKRGLRSLPPKLDEYVALRFLDLNENSIASLPDNGFAAQTALQRLKLDSNLLTVFPSEAFKPLVKLKELDVERNPFQVSAVPLDTFTHMTDLEQLYVRSFSTLNRDVSGLDITSEHLKHQTKLKHLDIDSNLLIGADVETWGDEETARFKDLTEFSATATKITRMPAFLAGLPRLDSFRLDFNEIAALDKGDIPSSVTAFDLSANFIPSLEQDVLPIGVEEVKLAGNRITTIDIGVFSSLTKLKALALTQAKGFTSCHLTDDGNVTCSCADGLYRSLRGDACTLCPEFVPGFPDSSCDSAKEGTVCTVTCGAAFGLAKEHAPSNPYLCSAVSTWFTLAPRDCSDTICGPMSPCNCTDTRIDCSSANLTAIPGGLPRNTTHIDLSHNSITAVPFGSFDGLENLVKIDLSHNLITIVVDAAFADLPALRHLDLSYNAITGLDGLPFGDLFTLLHLNLADNDITFINGAGALSQCLKPLYDIDGIDAAAGTETGFLNMENNPLTCNHVIHYQGDQVFGMVECNCTALGTTELPFCPTDAKEYRFQCHHDDATADVSSKAVCDGSPDCHPSGVDEAVCEGQIEVASTSDNTCLVPRSAVVDECPLQPYSCFKTVSLTVNNGIVTLRSAIPCGHEHCPPAVGVVTARGSYIGSGERYRVQQQGTSFRLHVNVEFKQSPYTVACDFVYGVTSGMPAGVVNTQTTAMSSSFSPSIGSSLPLTTSKALKTTPTHAATSAPASSSTHLGMAEQVTIVSIVCVVLTVVLVLVGAFLYRQRLAQIKMEQEWLQHAGSRPI